MNTQSTNFGNCEIDLAGERLWLLPQRAVWWPSCGTLLIADTHFGKEATFRSAAIPVPDQASDQLSRLDRLLADTNAARLIILGDLLHSRKGRCEVTFTQISTWFSQRPELAVELVRGNHDLSAGDPPDEWNVQCHDQPYHVGPLDLFHDVADQRTNDSPPVLAGHLHPMARLRGRAGDSARLPCFLLRQQVLTVPAFSPFVDGKAISARADDRVYAICDNQVLPLFFSQ